MAKKRFGSNRDALGLKWDKNPMKKSVSMTFGQVITWFEKYQWQVVLGLVIFIVSFQVFEIFNKNALLSETLHIVEVFLYAIILTTLGLLIDTLRKSNDAQDRYMKILEFKHRTSLELTEIEDWDMLVPNLVRVPGKIASLEACRLMLHNPISGQQEILADWTEPGASPVNFTCQDHQKPKIQNGTQRLDYFCPPVVTDMGSMSTQLEYCLPVIYANQLFAIFHFRLKNGETLSKEQKTLLESIIPEIAMALKVNQEHRMLFELRQTQLAMEERRSISNYLHDTLSPNLAYLGLKLSQFISGQEQSSMDEGQQELLHMKEAVNQSYDIVRKIIETIHPVTTPCLANLLDTKIQEVSNRARINISLEKKGKELAILPETQQAVFYVFQEALNNVEKHSGAENAKVVLEWRENELALSIQDDGTGFEPASIDTSKHFGLDIMQERMKKVKGRVEIHSSIQSGTEVSIVVPVAIITKSAQKGFVS